MDQMASRFQELFFELFESLPRQGPGNRACAARALGLCRDLPPSPAILDLGCGTGGQTLHLADLTSGPIVAIDCHAPSIERFRAILAGRGLAHRIRALVSDMARSGQQAAGFDLVWSEGALYQIGMEKALRICRGLLRPGGYLAFTDAVWRSKEPAPEVRACFAQDYPAMGRVADLLVRIGEAGFEPVGHFLLPEEAWWDDFYGPMEHRIGEMRGTYRNDAEALAILDRLAEEPRMHRRHSGSYAYAFFVARRPPEGGAATPRLRTPGAS